MRQLLKSSLVNLRVIKGSDNEKAFVVEMFMVEDIRRYYFLNAVQAAQLDMYVENMAAANVGGTELNCIIERKDGTKVGLISVVPEMYDAMMCAWNVSYAVASAYRRKGYAYDALRYLICVLQITSIPYIMLDISENNKASEQLAIKLGFEKRRGKEHLFDKRHPDFGYHNFWIRGTSTK